MVPQRLRSASRRCSFPMESARIATWRFDIDDHVFVHSNNFGLLFGLTEKVELKGFHDLQKLIHEDEHSRFINAITDALHQHSEIDIDNMENNIDNNNNNNANNSVNNAKLTNQQQNNIMAFENNDDFADI